MQEPRISRTPRSTPIERPVLIRRRDPRSQDRAWRSAAARPPIRVSAEQVLSEEHNSFGTVFIISLDEIFRVLGGRTERITDALRFMGESTLRMRLAPDDKFFYDDAGRFRVRFGGKDHHSAREMVELLVDELGRRAIGNRFITWESIRDDDEFQTA